MDENNALAQYQAMIRAGYDGIGVITHPSPIYREEELPGADGSLLHTYFYFPEEAGVFPVIIQRQPYAHLGMDVVTMVTGEEYAKRGYIYICQHCRGTGKSQGKWEPYQNERADGKVFLDWVASQSWCGNIGIMGGSYLSLVGWAVADIAPEKVKTMFLSNYGVDRYASNYTDGFFHPDILTSWAMENAGFPIEADFMDSVRFLPAIEVDEQLWGKRLDWYRDYLTNTSREDPFWNEGIWKEFSDIPAGVTMPLYVRDEWYDHHLASALYAFNHLPESVRAHSTLAIGGADHFGSPCIEGRETKYAMLNDAGEQYEWFERILKRGELPEGKVLTYSVGQDKWQRWDSWPLPAEDHESFFLSEADQGGAFGLVTDQDSICETEIHYEYDPRNPVPTLGGDHLLHSKELIGSRKQNAPGWREDVISFLSEPFPDSRNILGRMHVELYVSTDAEDTAFTVKVVEQLPDGTAFSIRSGMAVISAQNPDFRPGETVRVQMELLPIDWMVQEGSRLRIDVSSSDCPQYTVHTNCAGLWYEQREAKTAMQTIRCGKAYPSCLRVDFAGK